MEPPAEEKRREIAFQLDQERSGGLVCVDVTESRSRDGTPRRETVLYFTAVPTRSELAFVHEFCVFALERKDVCTVMSMHERYYSQKDLKWTAKDYGDGRVTALCCFGGTPRPSKSTGIRNRVSKKQGCPARIKMRNLMRVSSRDGSYPGVGVSFRQTICRAVVAKINGSLDPVHGRNIAGTPSSLLFVIEMNMIHTCELSAIDPSGNRSSRRVFSSVEASESDDIRRELEDFMSIPGRDSRGNVAPATTFLEKKLPHVSISESVVRNTIASIMQNNLDADSLVKYLQNERNSSSGTVEYLHIGSKRSNGSLNFCAWAPRGSRKVVEKYGAEVGTVDSTYKTTKYNVKLFSWIIPDCTGRSRAVLFVMLEDERICNFQTIISDNMRAFSVKLPSVLFSDNCHAFYSALAAAPQTTTQILCIWHLLDN